MGELMSSLIVGTIISLGRLLSGKRTLVEAACIGYVVRFAITTLPSAMMVTLIYSFGIAYMVMTRFPAIEIFREAFLPRIGGPFVTHIIPLAVANLVIVKGVVAMASDIASMRSSQELDSLEVIGFHPVHLVLMPRAWAMMITSPLLFGFGILSAFFGTWLATELTTQPPIGESWRVFVSSISMWEASLGLLKIVLTAGFVSILGGYYGFRAGRRVESIGRTATGAVVTAIIATATINLLIEMLL